MAKVDSNGHANGSSGKTNGNNSNGMASSNLVDIQSGLISREIFVDDDIYQREQEQVFARSWLFIGHESQVEKAGDYFVSRMGEESVILCRDREGQIHAFLNSCRHRGMKVCRYDEGNAPVFTCPYHGWSYATDGKLVGVPYFKSAYDQKLDKSQWGLVEVAQLCNYKGGIWATWDGETPAFLDYIGDYKLFMDFLLDGWDGTEGGTEVFGGIEKWSIPCNWKFPSENFIGDRYHNISHRSVDLVGIGPSGGQRRDTQERAGAVAMDVSFPERGHGSLNFIRPDDTTIAAYQHSAVVSEYFAYCEEQRRKLWGTRSRVVAGPGTMFPNMSFLPRQPRTIAVWHPDGAGRTEAWRWFLVDKAAPIEVKEFLRQYYIRYSGPAGLTEQDDMENWNYAHSASKGVIARRYAYNYQMGRNFPPQPEGLEPKMPGQAVDVTKGVAGEQNQRGFYSRWAEFMDAPSWKELATWKTGKKNGKK